MQVWVLSVLDLSCACWFVGVGVGFSVLDLSGVCCGAAWCSVLQCVAVILLKSAALCTLFYSVAIWWIFFFLCVYNMYTRVDAMLGAGEGGGGGERVTWFC